MRSARGTIGFPASASSSMFPPGKAVFTERRPPSLTRRLHPLMSFLPLRSSPFRASLAFRLRTPSLGFLSLFAASTGSVLVVVSRFHDASVLGVSHVFDGFSAPRFVGLFHPTTTSRVSLQGLAPRAQPWRPFDLPCPLVVWLETPANGFPSAPASRAPPSGLISVREVVADRAVFSRFAGSPPSWVFLLQVLSPGRVEMPSHLLPPMTFKKSCRCHLFFGLRRVDRDRLGLPLSRLPTCSRFLAC